MRPWVKWCVNHKCKFVIYFVWAITLPAYIVLYIPEAYGEWIRELDSVRRLK